MLKNGIRELAYLVTIDEIKPIPNYDRVEYARTNGWWCVVRKGQFQVNDPAIYFEVDSKVPETEPFDFLAAKHYIIKTQKMCKVLSQGLLMSPSDFGWTCTRADGSGWRVFTLESIELKIGDGVTSLLGVAYADPADNVRKSNKIQVDPNASYKRAMARHKKIMKSPVCQWMLRRPWGKKIVLGLFGGKKKRTSTQFPNKFALIRKTDEERVENMTWILNDKRPLIATEKLDGTSTTYIMERKPFNRYEFWVLSRNVRQLKEDQQCFHEYNIYWEMAKKYNVEKHLKDYLKANPNLDYVCIQGESVGSVQGNPLKLAEDRFYGYNFIRSDVGRISSLEGKAILESWGMEWVPILSTSWTNPDTMEEMKTAATGYSKVNSKVLREGVVYRDPLDPTFSFKNVSNEFLLSKKGG